MKYLILGGTGTLGRETVKRLIVNPDNKVTVFSRDELKQRQMSEEFDYPNLYFTIGDIRDPEALIAAMYRVDVVFHFAALKHVDVLECNPEESIRTNVTGTQNVADAAIASGVKHVVFSSTDKAVSPINVYGMSKAISERILLHKNETQDGTHFSVFRWGNVVGSRGSAIHSFAKSLKANGKAYVTDPLMTRYWIRIEDAVKFMLETYETAQGVMIPEMKSSGVLEMIAAVAKIAEVQPWAFEVVGRRPGEKVHESILPTHSSADGPFYSIEELAELVRPVL